MWAFPGGYHSGITGASSPWDWRCSWCRAFPSNLKHKLISAHVLDCLPWWPKLCHGWNMKQIHVWELQGHRNWGTRCWKVQLPTISGTISNSPLLILEISFSLSSLRLSWVWQGNTLRHCDKAVSWAPLKLYILWCVNAELFRSRGDISTCYLVHLTVFSGSPPCCVVNAMQMKIYFHVYNVS